MEFPHRHNNEIGYLRDIDHTLRELLHRMFPVPTQAKINLEGASAMNAAKTYPLTIGSVTSLPATEFDADLTPPAPFTYAKGSVVYAATGGSGTFVDNGDGTFKYTLPVPAVPEVVVVTLTDSVSNPNKVLTDTATLTFQAPAELPTQANINLP